MELSYTVVLEPEQDSEFEGYYNAIVPALPGCLSYGASEDEALRNIKEAIAGYLEALREKGLPIPKDEAARVEKVIVSV